MVYGIPITMAHANDVRGVLYGVSWRKIGMTVIHPYRIVQTLTHDNTRLKIVSLILHRNTTRPAKNRNRETCSNVGNASTAHGRRNFSTPSEKNARIRARLCGLYRG